MMRCLVAFSSNTFLWNSTSTEIYILCHWIFIKIKNPHSPSPLELSQWLILELIASWCRQRAVSFGALLAAYWHDEHVKSYLYKVYNSEVFSFRTLRGQKKKKVGHDCAVGLRSPTCFAGATYFSDLWLSLSHCFCSCWLLQCCFLSVFIIVIMTVCPGPYEPAAIGQEEFVIGG